LSFATTIPIWSGPSDGLFNSKRRPKQRSIQTVSYWRRCIKSISDEMHSGKSECKLFD
jgi:hypothetical protein